MVSKICSKNKENAPLKCFSFTNIPHFGKEYQLSYLKAVPKKGIGEFKTFAHSPYF